MFSFENLMTAFRANFLWAVGVNVPIALASYVAGVVRGSGLIAGLACGLVIYLCGGYQAFLVLLFFFVAGSVASKVGLSRKAVAGTAEETEGARGAGSVIGKCSVGAILALLIGASGGLKPAGDGPSALLCLGYSGAFAAALADTLASELGPLFGQRALLPRSMRLVPHGVPGAVSVGGTASGLVGALVIGALAAAFGMIRVGEIAYVVVASLAAVLSESILRSYCSGQSLLQKQIPNSILTLIGALLTILLAVAAER
jgi:uncharacterized protein (TIGR00297 family)